MLTPGTVAPPFRLQNDRAEEVTEKQLHGSWTALYFYPKDDTPGCTTEACSFRDSYPQLLKAGVQVIGVSKDSVRRHQAFKQKYALTFMLLADTAHEMAEAYEVWVEKSMYGKSYWGMERSTYLISPAGVIVAAYPNVTPTGHAQLLIAELAVVQTAP
jgi:peroxiredoxin Q/BCP